MVQINKKKTQKTHISFFSIFGASVSDGNHYALCYIDLSIRHPGGYVVAFPQKGMLFAFTHSNEKLNRKFVEESLLTYFVT